MDRYGIDKPDLRFGLELVELTPVFASTEFKAFAGAGAIKGIRVPGGAAEYGRNFLEVEPVPGIEVELELPEILVVQEVEGSLKVRAGALEVAGQHQGQVGPMRNNQQRGVA